MEDTKTQESAVLPIVAKAQKRFFYSLTGLSALLYILIFLFDLRYVLGFLNNNRNGSPNDNCSVLLWAATSLAF